MPAPRAPKNIQRPEAVDEAVAREIALLRDGIDRDDIYGAMQGLAKIGAPAVDSLIRILKDPKERPIVRARAGETLALIGDRRAVRPLIDVLDDPDVELRWHAVVSLGKFRAVEAVTALRRLAAGDDGGFGIGKSLRVTVRNAAAEALRKIEG
jgi:HEAT repeat protein